MFNRILKIGIILQEEFEKKTRFLDGTLHYPGTGDHLEWIALSLIVLHLAQVRYSVIQFAFEILCVKLSPFNVYSFCQEFCTGLLAVRKFKKIIFK